MNAAGGNAYGSDVGPAELAKQFRFTGRADRLAALFAPPVQKAILSFPRLIYQIMFDGKTVSLVWLDWETDTTIVDQALDIAWAMGHQVEIVRTPAQG